MISLAYYLRVIAAMWMSRRAPRAGAALQAGGGSRRWPAARPRPTRRAHRARGRGSSRSLFGAATLFFGIVPSPLFDLAVQAGRSLTQLF